MRRIAILSALVMLSAGAARGGSIWARGARRTAAAGAIHADDTAKAIGDVLTVIIAERSVVENETSRDMDKSETRSAETDGTLDLANLIGSVGRHIFDFPKLNLSTSASSKFEGSANYDSDRTVTDQVTVVVQDVLPNGNLVVLGTRVREVAGESQTVRVSGIVRPSDITFANTVRSEKVAEFRVSFSDPPAEKRFTAPGWLARLLNWMNPF